MRKKNLVRLLLSLSLILGLMSPSGCFWTETNTVGPETQTQIIKNITPKEALTLIQENHDNPNFMIIDVRTSKEFAEEHIEGAINLDYYSKTFREQLNKLDKNKTYLVYCRTGRRSERALDLMKELGFREVYNISGGIIDWKVEGLPITKQAH
ncbi:MAG: rhodanese-like domain-containing protein [Dehalococcoidia bacterium]|nr:rhodanese-like domain-containing protein [Dehalococcoidia bacterium]